MCAYRIARGKRCVRMNGMRVTHATAKYTYSSFPRYARHANRQLKKKIGGGLSYSHFFFVSFLTE